MLCKKLFNIFSSSEVPEFSKISDFPSKPATLFLHVWSLKRPNTPGCLAVRLAAGDGFNTTTCSTDVGYQHPAQNIMTACPFDYKGKTIALFISTNESKEPLLQATYDGGTGFIYFNAERTISEEEANNLVITALQNSKIPREY